MKKRMLVEAGTAPTRVLWYLKDWKATLDQPYRLYLSSNRMRVYNLHECIKNEPDVISDVAGYTTQSPDPFSYDIVIFQKHFDSILSKMLRRRGVTVVFDICDPYELYRDIHELGHLITTNSHELADYFRAQTGSIPVAVVEEPYESNPDASHLHGQKDRLLVTWYGSPPNYYNFVKPLVDELIPRLDFVDFRWAGPDRPECHVDPYFEPGIEMHMDWREAWHTPNSWLEFIRRSDIGLVPVPTGEIKPRHKVLSYMAYGIPVVCSPRDAYRRLVANGENGYLAASVDEWHDSLLQLRDVETRIRLGSRAREDVCGEHVPNLASRYWATVLHHHGTGRTPAEGAMTRWTSSRTVYSAVESLRTIKGRVLRKG